MPDRIHLFRTKCDKPTRDLQMSGGAPDTLTEGLSVNLEDGTVAGYNMVCTIDGSAGARDQ